MLESNPKHAHYMPKSHSICPDHSKTCPKHGMPGTSPKDIANAYHRQTVLESCNSNPNPSTHHPPITLSPTHPHTHRHTYHFLDNKENQTANMKTIKHRSRIGHEVCFSRKDFGANVSKILALSVIGRRRSVVCLHLEPKHVHDLEIDSML